MLFHGAGFKPQSPVWVRLLRIPLNMTWMARHLQNITAQIPGPPLLHMDSFSASIGFFRVFFSTDLMYHLLFTKGVVSSFVMW